MPTRFEVPVYAPPELTALPDHPIVIRGLRAGFECGSVKDLLLAAGSPAISGSRDGDVCEYFTLSSEDVVRHFREGTLPFNAVDSYVDDADGKFLIPGPIADGNLLTRSALTSHYRTSLVITQKGTFTRTHTDGSGLGGWMYLFSGRKKWHLWDRVWFPLLYDVVEETCFDDLAHPHHAPAYREAMENLPRWEVSIGAGDCLWFPEGWPHRVWTSEDSYGYGGSTLHEARLGHAVEAMLRDCRFGFSGTFDPVAFLEGLQREYGFRAEPHLARIEAVRQIWARNR